MDMGTKLIITESQLGAIKRYLNETDIHGHLVERLVGDLNTNYEPMIGIVREDGEYLNEPMIKVKVDESSITPKELYEYLIKKYSLGEGFTQQVIKDWMFGTLEGNKLSKNVAIN